MKMIVGLGNVGKEYVGTRHNVGFQVLDLFDLDFSLEKKFQAYLSTTIIENEKVLFVKPTTFMNLSGIAVSKIATYYDILPEDILVIQDDMDLPFGKIKIKKQGSSGGHNGIKSIIEQLHTENFNRLKIGIDHPQDQMIIDYVLGHFSKKEIEFIQNKKAFFADVFSSFVSYGIEKTMTKFNGQ